MFNINEYDYETKNDYRIDICCSQYAETGHIVGDFALELV